MHENMLFPGVVLLVLMIIFSFTPLPVSSSPGTVSNLGTLTTKAPALPYSGPAPLTITWSGGLGPSVWVAVLPCPSSGCTSLEPKPPVLSPPPTSGVFGIGNGTSGSFTIWAPTTGSLLILTNSTSEVTVTVTWNEMPELNLIWEVLGVVGVLLAIGGIVLPEKGSPRGHHRRLHYFHWRHHPFALPPHLPSEGLTCSACGLTDIPHEDDNCPKCGAPLPRGSNVIQGPPSTAAPAPARPLSPRTMATSTPASAPSPQGAEAASAGPAVVGAEAAAPEAAPAKKRVAVDRSKVAGQALSVADPDPLRPWRVMKGLGFQPEDALVFTREDPQVLEEKYHLQPSQVYIVSRSEGEHTISPSESDRIADLADQHFQTHPGGVVILTDPNYFVTHGGFDMLRRLVLAIQDHAREKRGTLILGFNPGVFSADQRAQLEERMRKVV